MPREGEAVPVDAERFEEQSHIVMTADASADSSSLRGSRRADAGVGRPEPAASGIRSGSAEPGRRSGTARRCTWPSRRRRTDRKSTRLNSSHVAISYAVFCLKKKKNTIHM